MQVHSPPLQKNDGCIQCFQTWWWPIRGLIWSLVRWQAVRELLYWGAIRTTNIQFAHIYIYTFHTCMKDTSPSPCSPLPLPLPVLPPLSPCTPPTLPLLAKPPTLKKKNIFFHTVEFSLQSGRVWAISPDPISLERALRDGMGSRPVALETSMWHHWF